MDLSKTLITILATQQSQANAMAEQMQQVIDGTPNGSLTFTVPLFDLHATDDSVIVRYWSAPLLTPANREAVGSALVNFPGATVDDYDCVANPDFPNQKIVALDLRRALPKTP